MKLGLRTLLACLAAGSAGIAFLALATPASAHPGLHQRRSHPPRVVYVGHQINTSTHHRGRSCRTPDFTAIQPAIEAVALHGTVVVCPGTYPGMVNVDKSITLSGRHGATIDATGSVYGIGVSASWSTVTGMTVTGASPLDAENGLLADGILTAAIGPNGPVAADHIRIVHNVVTGNLGSGIDINSSSYSTAAFNKAIGNGVGINVADDLNRPAEHNTIIFNRTNGNFGGCGIALADHTTAGVRHNLVAFNVSDDNGLSTPTAPDASAGSGVILASPAAGGAVTDNTIVGNEFHGNGHGGVVVHAHVPGADFSGNAIIGNRVGTNNLRTDLHDPETTGIYLGSASPMRIRVSGNIIGPDYYGIFASGPVTIDGHNHYRRVHTRLGATSTY